MASGIVYTYEEVKEILKNKGYKILCQEYKNARSKIIIEDEYGYKYETTFSGILSDKSPRFSDRRNPFFYENICIYLKNKNATCSFLSTAFQQKVEVLCECGSIYFCTADNLTSGNQIFCPACAIAKRGLNHRIPYEEVIKIFKNNNITPLNFEYIGIFDKIECVDSDGYYGFISTHKLKQGNTFDIVSKYNPYSIQNIKIYIEKYNLNCNIVSNKYINALSPLVFMCSCGKEYRTTWQVFMSLKNDRCQRCSKKQSKYAYEFEEFLIQNNIVYSKEKTINGCLDKHLLLFDFRVIISNITYFIEIDGETHFIPAWGGIEGLKLQQKRDTIKNNFCLENNINLIRISYVDIKNKKYIDIINKLQDN